MHDLINIHGMHLKHCVTAQDAFLKRVATYGGVAGVVRSVACLERVIAMSEVQAA